MEIHIRGLLFAVDATDSPSRVCHREMTQISSARDPQVDAEKAHRAKRNLNDAVAACELV
jgi:hypothetical protein